MEFVAGAGIAYLSNRWKRGEDAMLRRMHDVERDSDRRKFDHNFNQPNKPMSSKRTRYHDSKSFNPKGLNTPRKKYRHNLPTPVRLDYGLASKQQVGKQQIANMSKRSLDDGVRFVKRGKGVSKKTTLSTSALTDMICPKYAFSTPFCEAIGYNIIDMVDHNKENALSTNSALTNSGSRFWLQDQDFVQHIHMPVKMWFEGVRRAAKSPKAISTALNLVDTPDNVDYVDGGNPGGNLVSDPKITYGEDQTYYTSNIKGTMQHYSCDYTITSTAETPFMMEFTECCPNKVLFENPYIQTNVVTTQAGYTWTNASTEVVDLDPNTNKDPLSSLKRDLIEAHNQSRFNFGFNNVVQSGGSHNTVGSNFNEVDNAKLLNTHGVSVRNARDNFKRDYRVLSTKTICVKPGETIKYRLTVSGFTQSAKKFSRYDNQFSVVNVNTITVPPTVGAAPLGLTLGPNTVTTKFNRIPMFDEHTKFLLIRAYGTKLVGNKSGTANITNINCGSYKIVSKINCAFQYVPYVRKATQTFAVYDSGFALDGSAYSINSNSLNAADQTCINMQTDEPFVDGNAANT